MAAGAQVKWGSCEPGCLAWSLLNYNSKQDTEKRPQTLVQSLIKS